MQHLLTFMDVLRMYCMDTGAIVFMFDGGSSYGPATHPIDTKIGRLYRLLNGLNGIKGSIPLWTNHINYEKCIEHWFLAPCVYLCSTSLKHVNTVQYLF